METCIAQSQQSAYRFFTTWLMLIHPDNPRARFRTLTFSLRMKSGNTSAQRVTTHRDESKLFFTYVNSIGPSYARISTW